MTVEVIKQELKRHVGDQVIINYNLGRNKYETYDVKIKELYDHIFLVESSRSQEVRSFSYSDVLTKTIKIDYS